MMESSALSTELHTLGALCMCHMRSWAVLAFVCAHDEVCLWLRVWETTLPQPLPQYKVALSPLINWPCLPQLRPPQFSVLSSDTFEVAGACGGTCADTATPPPQP